MINIKKLTETDKGKTVIYKNYYLKQMEEGVITNWNNDFIFVRYGNDKESKATYPKDLEWAFKINNTTLL